ncbi:MAG: hypothetical protein QXT06_05980 [Candidatus Bathyarchaeia archaeon]
MAKKDFDTLLLKALDKTLNSLGQSVKDAIYYHLENTFKIPKETIPKRIDEFAEAIEKIFGIGARFLEMLIIKNLYEEIGESIEWKEGETFTFKNYLKIARNKISEES